MEKQINLKIETKEFTNETGDKISYFVCTADIKGTKIQFKPIDEDKKLFRYLLSIDK